MKTIYFVHDQQESPSERQNTLEMAGYDVRMMTSSRDLYAALKQEEPSLVLMDILIEGKNGFEAVREISRRYPDRDYPIVLSTRLYRARQFREEARRSGAQDLLLLPMKQDAFLRRVHQAIMAFVPPDQAELDSEAA